MSESVRVTAGHRRIILVCSVLALSLHGVAARAADPTPPQPALPTSEATGPEQVPLPPVVVTATMLATPISEIGSSITVITSQDIEPKQERTLPEVLNDVPGLTVVQTGSPGGQTSVFS
jgi:vitamin B12 transporter